jgi:hypothetical protein
VNTTKKAPAGQYISMFAVLTGVMDFGIYDSGKMYFYGVDDFCVSSNTDITDGVWHFMVLRRMGDTYDIFRDAVNDGTGNKHKNISNTSDLCFGRAQFNNGYQGYMDEVSVWSRAISNAEITELYREVPVTVLISNLFNDWCCKFF